MDSPLRITEDFWFKALWRINQSGKETGQAKVHAPVAEPTKPQRWMLRGTFLSFTPAWGILPLAEQAGSGPWFPSVLPQNASKPQQIQKQWPSH